jgi:capsular polysaccharide transport system permease protein
MAHNLSARPRGIHAFAQGLGVQGRVMRALVLRELHTRYGRSNIGYLWVILEPMILASVIALIHYYQPTHFGSDIAPVPFAIIGYTIFIIFRGIFNRAEGSIEANHSLLHHRIVSINDIIFSRAMLDAAGCFITMCILLAITTMMGLAELPERPHHLLIAVMLMTWWSVACGMIAIGLTYGSHSLGRLMHPVAYFCIPVSGAFFQMSWVPENIANILKWFPMVLIFEEARYGQFRSASDKYVDPAYVVLVCAGLSYWGLILCRRLRRRVAVR